MLPAQVLPAQVMPAQVMPAQVMPAQASQRASCGTEDVDWENEDSIEVPLISC